ncbi:MAG: class I SAM-dependent methyltransferase [Acidimicrobiia bacterium]
MTLPEHAAENLRYWNGMADDWVAMGERAWDATEITWGEWGVPEADLRLLPDDVTGLDVIELGCGTGYVSGWLARRGARVTGLDLSDRQLATARRLADEHGADIRFVRASAEDVPFPDDSFELAVSEYGAPTWCDPDRWLPEAARILRPGGRLVFLTNHPLTHVATPADGSAVVRSFERPWFGPERHDWREAEVEPGGIEYGPTPAGWIRRLRAFGFSIEAYHELRAPEGDGDEVKFFVDRAWAHDFPSEHVWVAELEG